MNTQLLLIDDDKELCDSLKRIFSLEDLAVTAAHDSVEGARLALSGQFALVILDVMLPGGDGRTALRHIRATSDVPVIMLTARGGESDRIAGFDAGADDYLPKPFHVRELIARVRAVLKRRMNPISPTVNIAVGDLQVQPASRTVLRNGQVVTLTGTEYEVLLLLVRSAGRVVSRDQIAEVCLGRPVGPFDRSVDNHVSNLRKKLGPLPGAETAERIRSLRGAGYIYCTPLTADGAAG